MQISTRPITLLDFAKLAILGIFLNYYGYLLVRGSFIPYGTPIFFAIAVACTLTSLFQDRIRLSPEIVCWILYLTLSLVTVVFAISTKTALDGLLKFGQRLVIIMMIAYICEKEKSIKFAVRLLAVTAIVCMICCLLFNTGIDTKLEMESGANTSTNDIGSLMAYGCFAVLFAFGLKGKRGVVKTAAKILYIIGAVSVIFLAGSRKSILAIFILFGLLFVLCSRNLFKNLSTVQFLFITLLIIGAVVFVYYFLLPNAENTDLYQRVFGRKAETTETSDESRINLYLAALNDFKENIFVGLGFNNFRYIHMNYSHSTYVEPLACSGIIGFLYLAPYVMMLVKQIKLIKLNKDNIEERLWQKELLAFYISFLFVGIGIPYMYKDIPCIILAMFIASQKISFDKIEERKAISVSEGVTRDSKTDQSFAGAV